jgi:hypothetical protein
MRAIGNDKSGESEPTGAMRPQRLGGKIGSSWRELDANGRVTGQLVVTGRDVLGDVAMLRDRQLGLSPHFAGALPLAKPDLPLPCTLV